MKGRTRVAPAFLVAIILSAAVVAAATPAHAGFVTGAGASRTGHLEDASNGVTVTVQLNETFNGEHENTFTFEITGSAGTAARAYSVRLTVNPHDPEVATAWHTNATGPTGAATTEAAVIVPADALPYRVPNVPFSISLADASGELLDSVDFAMDLTYRPPPADGGLFQLAAGTVAAWGLVLLYALYLHRAHQRLRARAESLERALGSSGREGDK